MKKIALASFALALVASLTSCNDKTGGDNNSNGNDSIPQAAAVDPGDGFAPTTNIRYIDMNKISQEYNLAKDLQDVIVKNESDIQQYHQNRSAEIQRLANQIEEKGRNNGYLSQQSYEADMKKLQQMQVDAENGLAKKQKDYQQQVEEQSYNIQVNIQNFLVEYNKTHHYDAILFMSAGAYFNPDLDITDEVIEGLNKIYNQYHE